MDIKIYGDSNSANILFKNVKFAIDELGLNGFIDVGIADDKKLGSELKVTKEPALIIEEKSIDFKDVIFEGIVPEVDELKSILVSIIGNGEGSCLGHKNSDCGNGCSCC